MKYKYAFKSEKENVAKVVGRDVNLSRKQAIELCDFVRQKPVAKAKAMLEKVIDKTLAVPYTKYREGAGHKTGAGLCSGKYPLHGAKMFILLLNSLEANAQNKGLSPNLVIIHACAQQAARPFHSGRVRRIRMKRVHIELAAIEVEPEKDKSKGKEKSKDNKKVNESKESGPKDAKKENKENKENNKDNA
jgi:large subunit ribosomal protein L22